MKNAVIFYSFINNTKKVAEILVEYLRAQHHEVDLLQIQALDESNNFFQQAQRAFRHKQAKIAKINFDLGNYALIAFGTPVWALPLLRQSPLI